MRKPRFFHSLLACSAIAAVALAGVRTDGGRGALVGQLAVIVACGSTLVLGADRPLSGGWEMSYFGVIAAIPIGIAGLHAAARAPRPDPSAAVRSVAHTVAMVALVAHAALGLALAQHGRLHVPSWIQRTELLGFDVAAVVGLVALVQLALAIGDRRILAGVVLWGIPVMAQVAVTLLVLDLGELSTVTGAWLPMHWSAIVLATAVAAVVIGGGLVSAIAAEGPAVAWPSYAVVGILAAGLVAFITDVELEGHALDDGYRGLMVVRELAHGAGSLLLAMLVRAHRIACAYTDLPRAIAR